jgi:hypothetical protein
MMFLVGALGLLLGTFFEIMSRMPIEELAKQSGAQMPPLPPGMTWPMVSKLAGIFGIVILIAAGVHLVVGGFVRRGSTSACGVGILLSAVSLLFFTFVLLSNLAAGQPGGVLIGVPALAAFGVQLNFLIKAVSNAPTPQNIEAARQAQRWQYLHQQQAYQTPAYNQNIYNAPPTSPQTGTYQTGWQMPAPPPPPPGGQASDQGGPYGYKPQ